MNKPAILIFLFLFCFNCYSQITLDNYYKFCKSYPPSHNRLVENIGIIDSLYDTGIMKDSTLLSRLICSKTWGFGYENYYRMSVDQKELEIEFKKYENVRKNLDRISDDQKKKRVFGLIALPGVLYIGILAVVTPIKALSGDDMSWFDKPLLKYSFFTLASISIPSVVISYSYRFKSEMSIMKIPYEYNGAVIIKNR